MHLEKNREGKKSCWNYCHQDPTRKVLLFVFAWLAVYASRIYFFEHNMLLRLCSPATICSWQSMPGFIAYPSPRVLCIPTPTSHLSAHYLLWPYTRDTCNMAQRRGGWTVWLNFNPSRELIQPRMKPEGNEKAEKVSLPTLIHFLTHFTWQMGE